MALIPSGDTKQVPYQERKVQTKIGTTLAIRIWGNEGKGTEQTDESKLWLCLHGFLDNAATFDLVAPRMVERGFASCMACIDFAGHGQSEGRAGGTYHALDHVADAVNIVDALAWQRFSIMGHSFGGGIAQAMAAVIPERVVRLVSVEALGLLPSHASTAVAMVRQNILDRDRGANPQTYNTLEECAVRRSKQNFVGSMPVGAAAVLVKRGTRPSPDAAGLVWSSDPALMRPSRWRLDETSVRSILQGITCPHAFVFASDGLWRRCTLFKLPLFSKAWMLVTKAVYWIAWAYHSISHLGLKPLVPELMLSAPLPKVAAYVHENLMQRWLCCRTAALIQMPDGGHHPHLTHPHAFLDALTPWLQTTATHWHAATSARAANLKSE
eukprot:CAMPEP_0181295214 /NCGR_PEP_ID=MMETSP1101-20121128/4023_1 /TAXON_ID=46948 /ORGANISM="Rhodomonas abbreviata, Strain Caron Lab Isolate" /LENGTH=382 /DNA_ID=CAMNT_0023399941 /DNA_START=103 /DNA_END=1251 /DNA_ORIENTATION=+